MVSQALEAVSLAKKIEEKITKSNTYIKMKFVNLTPFSSGDASGKPFRGERYVGGPQSYSLIGKMRKLCNSVEPYCTDITDFMFGYIDRRRGAFASPYNVVVKARPLGEPPKIEVQCLLQDLLRGKKFHVDFVAPKKLEVEVEVFLKPRDKMTNELAVELFPLFALTALATMTLYGVGRATRWGFGRFLLVDVEANESGWSDLEVALETLKYKADSTKPVSEMFKEWRETYVTVWAHVVEKLMKHPDSDQKSPYEQFVAKLQDKVKKECGNNPTREKLKNCFRKKLLNVLNQEFRRDFKRYRCKLGPLDQELMKIFTKCGYKEYCNPDLRLWF